MLFIFPLREAYIYLICVCVFVVYVVVSMAVTHVHAEVRSTMGIIPQSLSTIVFETVTKPEGHDFCSVGQGASWICLLGYSRLG